MARGRKKKIRIDAVPDAISDEPHRRIDGKCLHLRIAVRMRRKRDAIGNK